MVSGDRAKRLLHVAKGKSSSFRGLPAGRTPAWKLREPGHTSPTAGPRCAVAPNGAKNDLCHFLGGGGHGV